VQLQSLLEGRASGRRLLVVTLIPSATAFEFLLPNIAGDQVRVSLRAYAFQPAKSERNPWPD
jgi:hypothetical protein